jgi:Snapin/Pallidin
LTPISVIKVNIDFRKKKTKIEIEKKKKMATISLAQGLETIYRPLVEECDAEVHLLTKSQDALSQELDRLQTLLAEFVQLAKAPTLDVHIQRIQTIRRRMDNVSATLARVTARLNRLGKTYAKYPVLSTSPALPDMPRSGASATQRSLGQVSSSPASEHAEKNVVESKKRNDDDDQDSRPTAVDSGAQGQDLLAWVPATLDD